MLRFRNQLRLSSQERTTLSLVAGTRVNRRSVGEYNAIVMRAKSDLTAIAADIEPDLDSEDADRSGHAEARLLGALADGLLIAESSADTNAAPAPRSARPRP